MDRAFPGFKASFWFHSRLCPIGELAFQSSSRPLPCRGGPAAKVPLISAYGTTADLLHEQFRLADISPGEVMVNMLDNRQNEW